MNFAELFFAAADRKRGAPFIIDERGVLSYSECAKRTLQAADLFSVAGIRQGDRVAVAMRNSSAFIVAWLALANLGAVMVAMNAELRGDIIGDILADSGATFLIIETEILEIYCGSVGDRLSGFRTLTYSSADHFFELVRARPAKTCNTAVDDTQPLTILYSSGTTGKPKGAIASHRAYVLAGREMARGLEMSDDDRFYLFLPLYHANPQYYGVASSIAAGASIVIASRFSVSRFWNDVQRHRPTLFTYVGSVLPILSTTAAPESHSLRACVGGGVTPELWQTMEQSWNIRILELYGSTETAGFATINSFGARKIGTVGRQRDPFTLRIMDGDQEVGVGRMGEIVVATSVPHAMFDGYLSVDQTGTFGPHGFRTGDLGSVDDEGFFRYHGRFREIIRVRGENVAPAYVESLLQSCPLVVEAAVCGVPNKFGEEDLKICVVPANGCTPELVASWCDTNLPRFMRPQYIEFRPMIPKTSTMKVIRHELVLPSADGVLWTK